MAAEEFVDEDDYFQFVRGFWAQVTTRHRTTGKNVVGALHVRVSGGRKVVFGDASDACAPVRPVPPPPGENASRALLICFAFRSDVKAPRPLIGAAYHLWGFGRVFRPLLLPRCFFSGIIFAFYFHSPGET